VKLGLPVRGDSAARGGEARHDIVVLVGGNGEEEIEIGIELRRL
jgi:hypothetical protein